MTVLEFRCALYRCNMSNSAWSWKIEEKGKIWFGVHGKKIRDLLGSFPDVFSLDVMIRCRPCGAMHFYICNTKHSRVRHMLIGSIAVDTFRSVCTCPTPRHVAAEISSDIFLNDPWYSTLQYSVPPDRIMKTSSTVLHDTWLCTLFQNFHKEILQEKPGDLSNSRQCKN